ncbi:MAG: hypothetical protein GX493_06295 [Firmicutes bacterium]|nr:hypothetical protein [Bacillota bacterium]
MKPTFYLLSGAAAAVEFLRETCGLPVAIFVISGVGESPSLHPNDTPENRSRNRTVVVRIALLRNRPVQN